MLGKTMAHPIELRKLWDAWRSAQERFDMAYDRHGAGGQTPDEFFESDIAYRKAELEFNNAHGAYERAVKRYLSKGGGDGRSY